MTSQPTDRQRPTFLEALKQMGLLWVFPFLFAGALLGSSASWFMILGIFLLSIFLMTMLVRYPELRPIGHNAPSAHSVALERNKELAQTLRGHVSETEQIAQHAPTNIALELRNANRASQAVLDNPPK